jgi:tetratricopeptide (TPR) repeat protein
MLRCLKAINPTHCCFTATDFEDSLAEIESILSEINNHPEDNLDPVQLHIRKESTKAQLESAYILSWHCLSNSSKANPDKELLFLVADIISQYGQLCFHENYFAARQLLSVAMNLLFYSMAITTSPIDLTPFYSLKDLSMQATQKKNFSLPDDMLLTTSLEKLVFSAVSDSLLNNSATQRLFILAKTARFLGLSYKHANGQNENTSPILKQLFDLSEHLLLLIDNARSREELAHLYFSTWPLFSQSDHPTGQALTLYEKTITHCDTQEMRARVANKQFMIQLASGDLESAYKSIEKALSLANKTPSSELNPYMLSSIHNNYASLFLEQQYFDIEKADVYLKKACDFACQSRQAGEDRLYFAAYNERMAEVKYLLGDFKAAKTYIQMALATLENYPQSNQKLLPKTLALQSIIDKTLPDSFIC